MKKLTKSQVGVQNWIIDNYKDNPEYGLYQCDEHGVFAKKELYALSECPHCNTPCVFYNPEHNEQATN